MKLNMKTVGCVVAAVWMLSLVPVRAAISGGTWQYGASDTPDGKAAEFRVSSRMNEATLWTSATTSNVQESVLVWPGRSGVSSDGRTTVQVQRVALQPGEKGRYAIARWQAPAAGTYVLEAIFLNEQAGPGSDVDIHVLSRNRSCFDRVLEGGMPEQKLRLTVELAANEPIVFAAGASADGGANDSAMILVTIGAWVAGVEPVLQTTEVPRPELFAVTNSCRVSFENFSTGLAGWVVTPPVTGGEVFWNGAAVQADFQELPLPVPENIRIAAGRTASDGRFIGDWACTSIDEVSFDFYAGECAPSWIQLRIHDGTRYAFKGLCVAATNVWQHFTVNVESMEAGGWNGGITEADFAILRTNVQEVSLLIMRCGVAAQTYVLDNFSIDRVQRAVQWGAGSSTPSLTWSHLLSNRTYSVQAVRQPGDTNWVEVALLTATNSVSTVAMPMTNDIGFLRLVHN